MRISDWSSDVCSSDLAAAERLRDVVAFEIDRQTPFAAADVHYDAHVLGRNGEQIEAELVVVPRATFDAAMAALGTVAGTVAGVDVAGDDGAPLDRKSTRLNSSH